MKDVVGTGKQMCKKSGSVCVMKGETTEVYGKCKRSSSLCNPPELNGVEWFSVTEVVCPCMLIVTEAVKS
jgi:hypothetical protein